MNKLHEFAAYGCGNRLMAAKVVLVPATATEDDLNKLIEIYEDDLLCSFFTGEDDYIAQIVTTEIAGDVAVDYEASIDEDGAWDLRPL